MTKMTNVINCENGKVFFPSFYVLLQDLDSHKADICLPEQHERDLNFKRRHSSFDFSPRKIQISSLVDFSLS